MKLIDLTKRPPFGKLTVLRRVPSTNSQTRWECRCECGNITTVQGVHLRSGHTKSCGCSWYQFGEKHKSWKGYKEISSKFFKSIQYNAKMRQLPFEISIVQLWELFLKQKRKCALSGLPIEFEANHGRIKGTASLDRIDSTKGYTNDNVQWVHSTINSMKWDMPQEEFIHMCDVVSRFKQPVPREGVVSATPSC